MCWSCVREEMQEAEVTEVAVTPEMIEIAGLIEQFYLLPGCSVGGPLHITVEDGNIEDGNLAFCRQALVRFNAGSYHEQYRTIERDALGIQILDRLGALSRLERAVTCAMHHGDRYVPPGRTREFTYPTVVNLEGL